MQVRVLPGSSTHVTWLRRCGHAAFPSARLLSAFLGLCGLAFWLFVSQIAFYRPTPDATKKKETASREHNQLHSLLAFLRKGAVHVYAQICIFCLLPCSRETIWSEPVTGDWPSCISFEMKCNCFFSFFFEPSKYRIEPSDRSDGSSRITISIRNLGGLEWVHCTHFRPGCGLGTLRPWWLEILKIRVRLNPN